MQSLAQMLAKNRKTQIDDQKKNKKDECRTPLPLPTGTCNPVDQIQKVGAKSIGQSETQRQSDAGEQLPNETAVDSGKRKNKEQQENDDVGETHGNTVIE